jgi:2-polyprenyl-3-methyl-5-hydroxy-6-metoxy-1,4-benzoquinol methylase
MAEDSGQSVLSSLESHILPLVPGLTDRLTQGVRMLDLGCGRGRILTRLAALYPRSRFVGRDLSQHAIAYALREASRAGLNNIEFAAVDLSDFDQTAEPESFDFITTFDAIHHLLYALYDGFAGAGRRRVGGDVGRRKNAGVSAEGGFSLDHDALPGA